jgi:Tol biopolymer transport system component/DNA-binding winged helix-turn-helix (wHTH) protein
VVDHQAAPQLYEFGGFRLDRARRLLSRADGTPVALASRGFDALLYLVEHSGELVPRAALMKGVWPTTVVEENNLNKVISALRDALGDAQDAERYVVTVPGRGYQFVAAVRSISASGEPANSSSDSPGVVGDSAVDSPRSTATLDRRARPAWRRNVFAVAASVVALGFATALAVSYVRGPVAPPEMRVEITTPWTPTPAAFALSPDGRRLVFVGERDGRYELWLRNLDSDEAKPLPGTQDARHPFWSPDGESIGFFTLDELKRIDVGGGPAQTLAATAAGMGASWGPDGTIVFSASQLTPLLKVPATGGAPALATVLEPGRQTSHRFPFFLPDGRHFLFLSLGTEDASGIYVGSLDTPATQRIVAADSRAIYTAEGWLLFVRRQALVAQRFYAAQLRLDDEPVIVARSLASDSVTGTAAFSASRDGLIAYRSTASGERQLIWFNRAGMELGKVGAPDPQLSNIAISPDGMRVAVERDLQGNTDVWILDGARATRLTMAPGFDRFPVWSPDGTKVILQSSPAEGAITLTETELSGSLAMRVLLRDSQIMIPCDWSPDGRFLLYFRTNPGTSADLWVLPLTDGGEAFEFVKTDFGELWAQFSPDGRWVAYQSNETGRYEVVVRPFPASAPPVPVSVFGGAYPRWSSDGRELFFVAPDGTLMAAPVTASDASFSAGAPEILFQPRRFGAGATVAGRSAQYDVAPDGRFLVNTEADSTAPPITLLLNWRPPD